MIKCGGGEKEKIGYRKEREKKEESKGKGKKVGFKYFLEAVGFTERKKKSICHFEVLKQRQRH